MSARDWWETGEPPKRGVRVFAEHMNVLAKHGDGQEGHAEPRPYTYARAHRRRTSVALSERERALVVESWSELDQADFDRMFRDTITSIEQRRVRA